MKKLILLLLLLLVMLTICACSRDKRATGRVATINRDTMTFSISLRDSGAENMTFAHSIATRYEWQPALIDRRAGFNDLFIGQLVTIEYVVRNNTNLAREVYLLSVNR